MRGGDDLYMYGQNRFISGNPLQNRAQYGFEMVTSAQYKQFHEMKSEMPSDVLQLFKANEVGFLRAPIKKKCRSLDPVSTLGMNLAQMFSIPNLQLLEEEKRQTRAQRNQRIARQRTAKNQSCIQQKMTEWNPFQQQKVTNDPEKTLFVGRLSYKTTQKDIKHEFERYGLIKSVHLVKDQQGNSRGYAFVEFENKDDFNHAYKNANQRKLSGRRMLVDFERGRTLLQWRPKRFGGGLGQHRLTKQQAKKLEQKQKSKKEFKNQRTSRSRERSRDKRRNQQDRGDKDRGDRDNRRKQRKDRDRDRDRQRQRERGQKDRGQRQRKDKRDRKDRRDYE